MWNVKYLGLYGNLGQTKAELQLYVYIRDIVINLGCVTFIHAKENS